MEDYYNNSKSTSNTESSDSPLTQVGGEFVLPKKKVTIRPIWERARGQVKDRDHEAYFLVGTSTIDICPQIIGANGDYNVPLTEQEIDFFENKSKSRMNFNEGDLSPFYKDIKFDTRIGAAKKRACSFWESPKARIKLGKEPMVLDLSTPFGYLQYKILLSNTRLIATSIKDIYNKPEAIYVIVDENEEQNKALSKIEKTKRAYKILGKLEEDKEKMKDFLLVYGIAAAEGADSTFLITEVNKIIENNVEKFLNILEDPHFEMTCFITKCVKEKLIRREGYKYSFVNGDPIAFPGELNDLKGAVKFLSSNANQDFYLQLKSQLNDITEK